MRKHRPMSWRGVRFTSMNHARLLEVAIEIERIIIDHKTGKRLLTDKGIELVNEADRQIVALLKEERIKMSNQYRIVRTKVDLALDSTAAIEVKSLGHFMENDKIMFEITVCDDSNLPGTTIVLTPAQMQTLKGIIDGALFGVTNGASST